MIGDTFRKMDQDKLGMMASTACLVHCMLSPILLLAAPILGAKWTDGWVHWALAVFVLPLAIFALYRGFVRHRSQWVLALGSLGGVAIVLGLVAPFSASADTAGILDEEPALTATDTHLTTDNNPTLAVEEECSSCCPQIVKDEESGELSLSLPPAGFVTILGSILLVVAHASNRRLCACCETCVVDECSEG